MDRPIVSKSRTLNRNVWSCRRAIRLAGARVPSDSPLRCRSCRGHKQFTTVHCYPLVSQQVSVPHEPNNLRRECRSCRSRLVETLNVLTLHSTNVVGVDGIRLRVKEHGKDHEPAAESRGTVQETNSGWARRQSGGWAKARTVLRDMLGEIRLRPASDGRLWAGYGMNPATLIVSAVTVGRGHPIWTCMVGVTRYTLFRHFRYASRLSEFR